MRGRRGCPGTSGCVRPITRRSARPPRNAGSVYCRAGLPSPDRGCTAQHRRRRCRRQRAAGPGHDGRGRAARHRRRASTWPSRRAPAPASRWPTWCRRSGTRWTTDSPSWSPRPRIALQRQLVDRDLPRLVEALEPLLRPPSPTFAILKGRRNYLCLHRLHEGGPRTTAGRAVRPAARSARRPALGMDPARLHEWADETETGDRDELVPGVSEQAWRQVSVSAQECLGAQRCPYGADCFAEQARERGRARPTSSSPTTRCWPSTRIEASRVLPEHDVRDHRRGARAGRPGHLGGHRRAVRGHGRPRPRAASAG